MKLFFHLAVLFTGVLSFAGPEDYLQDQICYNLSTDQIAKKGPNVPSQICLEEVNVDLNKYQVTLYSHLNLQLFTNLKTDSFIRNTEDSYRFQLSNSIFENEQPGCGTREAVTLKVTGDVDIVGHVEKDQLKITVEEELIRNNCHIFSETTVYNYSL